MPYLTENKLNSVVDLPFALPATTLKQGTVLIVGTLKVATAQRLTLRTLYLQLLESPVDTGLLDVSNRVLASLGLLYVVLRKDYTTGNPGASGALEVLKCDAPGLVARAGTPLVLTAPGNYSLICVNNMQASTSSSVSPAVALDFKVLVTGQARLELST